MTIKSPFLNAGIIYFRAKPLRLVFAILWCIFVYLIISSGFSPDSYLLHVRGVPAPHPYPTNLVLLLSGVMVLHLILLITTDIFIRSGWKFFIMLIVTIPFFLYFGMLAMHASSPLTMMIVWQFLAFLLFLILCTWQTGLFFHDKLFANK